MTDKVEMGRTRKQAAKEGRRIIDIGKEAGLTEWNCTAFSRLSAAVDDFEAGGQWDAEYRGPLFENITDAGYAAEAVLEASRQPDRQDSE